MSNYSNNMQPRFNLKRDIRNLVYKYASDEYDMNDENWDIVK
jgi:hypothetical protein